MPCLRGRGMTLEQPYQYISGFEALEGIPAGDTMPTQFRHASVPSSGNQWGH